MNRQLRLALEHAPSYRREDLIVSGANAEAVRALDAWPLWHGGALALVGPSGSGKTHLSQIWLERAGAAEVAADADLQTLRGLAARPMLLEDADQAPPELLFHLINLAAEPGRGLLMTSRTAPLAWPCALPDLRSRLNALPVAEIAPPDDDILRGVLKKFFRERNIRPTEDVLPYLVRRMERSVPVAWTIVERLDEASGADHRPVSRALARQVLEDDSETPDLFENRLADPDFGGDKLD